uniref:Uncharacterized protein n=1 Tax=Cryptomonas curvata TaxID=233186 RepID=A0A7S0QKN9_9CRYP|mmetsp:Transcript_36954/g.77194  ORF Transcript_36954/g.77194 Transcript_36954/m.77194 type:complete len:185 (+) Transcript_36954:40-594(+)
MLAAAQHEVNILPNDDGTSSAMSIADLFFLDELSRTLGPDAGKKWLASVCKPLERKTILCKKKAPPLRMSSSFKIPRSKAVPASPSRESPTSSTTFTEQCITSTSTESSSAPPTFLHAWDLEDVVVQNIQLERTRSSPALMGNSQKSFELFDLRKGAGDPCKFGLLFTDAAHTVINDIENFILQ